MLENTYRDEIKEKVPVYKKAFHNNFKVAKKGVDLARDITSCLDPVKVKKLLERWQRERRMKFIAITGFWIPILEQYQQLMGDEKLNVDLLHLDAGHSPSYLVYGERCDCYNHIWFFDQGANQMKYEITITDLEIIPYEDREERFLAHGGGWGIGTYQTIIDELLIEGMWIDALAYYHEDIVGHKQIRYHMNDPHWSPWIKSEAGCFQFPPLALIEPGQPPSYKNQQQYPLIFDIIRRSKAIISKPGGYSLCESLAAATPFIFLEPFGKHEESNAKFWINQGFGIWYEDWKAERFSDEVIQRLHLNLCGARNKNEDYGGLYDAT